MRAPLAGALVVGLCGLFGLTGAGDALAKKKPKDAPEDAVAADKTPSDAANIQVAGTTAAPAATPPPSAGTARLGLGVSATVSPSDMAASCAKMISAAPDAATKNSIMQTCSQQLGGTPADVGAPAALAPPAAAPPSQPAAPPPSAEAAGAPAGRAFGKAGNFMVNFRLGYVPSFSTGIPTGGSGAGASLEYPPQGMLGAEFGFAISSQRKLYLVVPLTFQFQGTQAMIMLPFGFQYDIALPIPNLYITPRITLGYTAVVSSINLGSVGGGTTTVVGHAGLIAPEMGIKYILRERMNLGIDLLSVPIVFSPAFALVSYRVSVYLGANF